MSTQNRYERIEAYLNGELTENELKNFETELQNNLELAAQVRLLQGIDSVVADKPAINFQQIVRAEGESFFQNKETKIRRISWLNNKWAIAATFLVLIASTVLIWKMNTNVPLPNDQLFAKNLTAYPLSQTMRGKDATNVEFKKGINEYQAKNYEGAAETFQILFDENDQDMVLAFSLANAYLNTKPPKLVESASLFEQVIADGNSIYVSKAKWYLALIQLKNGEKEKAKNLLIEIGKSADNFSGKAKELLEMPF